jgi:hypothetical protein
MNESSNVIYYATTHVEQVPISPDSWDRCAICFHPDDAPHNYQIPLDNSGDLANNDIYRRYPCAAADWLLLCENTHFDPHITFLSAAGGRAFGDEANTSDEKTE